MNNMENVIYGRNIEKKFKKFKLHIEELKVPKGFATALIGENGAGKSTLLNILTGVRVDYKGDIKYFDEQQALEQEGILDRIGYTGPNNFFLPHWTVSQVREICSILFDSFSKEKFDAFSKRLNIPEGSQGIRALSDGNRMKLTLATAFCRETDLLIMDEPASPLDPLMRDMLCQLIREYLSEGNGEKSVFFSTHNISDMENVTDYAIIMNNGSIAEQGFVEELKEKYILVKGEPEDAERASNYLIGMSKGKYGFEGMCLAKDMDKLAGIHVSFETPTLSQISIAVMKQHTGLFQG